MERILGRCALLSCGVIVAGCLPAASAFMPLQRSGASFVVPPQSMGDNTGARHRTLAGRLALEGSLLGRPWMRSSLAHEGSSKTALNGRFGMLAPLERRRRTPLLRRMADVEGIDSVDRSGTSRDSDSRTEEIGLKRDLLDQVDLASSSEKRCVPCDVPALRRH